MNQRIQELEAQCWGTQQLTSDAHSWHTSFNAQKFAELIVKECADYIRSNYDNWEAEPLAFNMEKDFGLHGDYAE